MDWLDPIVFWHWWMLAGLLLILELTAPAFFFLWLGIAAASVGLILLVFPAIPLETQLVLFSIASIVSLFAWRKYRESRPIKTDQPNLNRRGHQYIGRVFTLSDPITNGEGKVTVDDSTWRIKGPDLPAGTTIKVTDVDGVIFTVEASG
ncbi:MAG: NfeD family protein [Xanthomonadales bacterium]|nr:NfeD family protein [Xanthomonadales bacterium]